MDDVNIVVFLETSLLPNTDNLPTKFREKRVFLGRYRVISAFVRPGVNCTRIEIPTATYMDLLKLKLSKPESCQDLLWRSTTRSTVSQPTGKKH